MSLYYSNHFHKDIGMHKEVENVKNEGKDQKYIFKKVKSERGEGEDTK